MERGCIFAHAETIELFHNLSKTQVAQKYPNWQMHALFLNHWKISRIWILLSARDSSTLTLDDFVSHVLVCVCFKESVFIYIFEFTGVATLEHLEQLLPRTLKPTRAIRGNLFCGEWNVEKVAR